LSALYYVDPQRFANDDTDVDLTAGLAARIVEENMSVSTPEHVTSKMPEYADDVIPIRQNTSISAALASSGYSQSDADTIAGNIQPFYGSSDLSRGDVLRMGILQEGEQT